MCIVNLIGVARIFSGVMHFLSSKKLTTLTRTAKFTTRTLQISATSKKCPQKFDFLLYLGMQLQLSPVNYAHFCLHSAGVHVHPVHPLVYAYD